MGRIRKLTIEDFALDNLQCYELFLGTKVHILNPHPEFKSRKYHYSKPFLCGKSTHIHPDDKEALRLLSSYISDMDVIYTRKAWDILCITCLGRLHSIVHRLENENV